jgi:hypothetical protein
MKKLIISGLTALASILGTAACADTAYHAAGTGRLLTNDVLADQGDRWRTGSLSVSFAYSKMDTPQGPIALGDVLEMRTGLEFITPSLLKRKRTGDRDWAGVLTLGLHAPFETPQISGSIGMDLAILGPQNGLMNLHDRLHDAIHKPIPSANPNKHQINNDLVLGPVVEIAKPIQISMGEVRPFVEVRGGTETLARIGVDLWLGQKNQFVMMSRDTTTGFRYGVGRQDSDTNIVGWIAGVDMTHVDRSYLFPSQHPAKMKSTRTRARLGFMAQQNNSGLFAGWTWLSPEFKGQDEGQVVGSIQVFWRF